MKNRLKKEIVKLAEEIISEKENLDTKALKLKAATLYEQLSILHFTEQNLKAFEAPEATETLKIETPEPKETPARSDNDYAPDGTEYREDADAITEPNTEKIKDIVAQMPPETEKLDELFSSWENSGNAPAKKQPEQKQASKQKHEPIPKKENPQPQKDFRDIGVDYDNLPNFEPINSRQKENKPKSINDRLKKGINIGLNERLSFIKHLFDGNTTDYNRVLSQLNTIDDPNEAKKFIEKIVKPDYNNWEGKDVYEEQFMEKIENKYRQ
ncbi:MAG TPA: hypothetical protein VLO29_03685 [Salegentibacter sp.]|nr:hypothetical protein [Salegentibacter sp.]